MTLVQIKSIRTACSNEFIASNDDLLTQILLYLPLKSIARFRSVSKHWLSLISSTPQFALSKPILALLLHHRDNPSRLDLLPLHHHHTIPHISPFRPLSFFGDGLLRCIHSCNGLLLCCQRPRDRTASGTIPKSVYFVYNPTTIHHTTLPPMNLDADDSLPFVSIVYDPPRSPHYKIVCFCLLRASPRTFQLVVYSSETRKWSLSRNCFMMKFYPYSYRKGVFWNGAIHWMTRRESFRFRVEEEKMIDNPMPPISNDWERGHKYFGVSCDRLYLINPTDRSRGDLNIYMMENDCSCWLLKHRVEIGNDLAPSFPELIWRDRFHIFAIMFLGQSSIDDPDPFLVVAIRGQVLCYNFESKTFRKIYDIPSNQSGPLNRRNLMDLPKIGAYQYIESLSLV